MQHFNLFSGFAKKENSTKQPGSGTTTLAVQGYFKDPCSVLNPVLKLERLSLDAVPYGYTYAQYVEGNKYYFIEDWVWAEGVWELHMKEDVLATYKTAIGNQSEYILRTDSTVNFNGEIIDTTYPATTDVVTTSYGLTNVFTSDISVGCYIVGIISGGSSQAVGAISYYAMTSAEFGALKEKLFSDDNLEVMGIIDSGGQQLVQDLSQEVLKTLYNPYQYIVSCIWFPFGVSAITSKTSVSQINIGWWEYSLSGYRLYAQSFELGNEQFLISAHPQSARGSYLNYAPYTRRTIIGRFGSVVVDTTCYSVGDKINISYVIDLITGQCRARVQAYNATVGSPTLYCVTEQHFLLAVPIQLAQIGVDYLGTAATAVSAAAKTAENALSLNVAGAISSAATGIYNTLNAAMPQMQTSGANGSFISPSTPTTIVFQFFHTVTNDIQHRGRPVCMGEVINTLSGYVQCADGEFDINCLAEERSMIADFMTGGFFWE